MDKEVEAIGKILKALEPLLLEARKRAIWYAQMWVADKEMKPEKEGEK